MTTATMVERMHRIFCISVLVCGLFGGTFYVTAQECSSIPLSDPTRVVATPPQSGSNYTFYERVSLSCNATGEYTFTGNDYSYCEGNNQWNPDPATVICYERCAGSLIPDDVTQEDLEGNAKSYYEHGEYIYLSCSASQTLIGPSRITCLDGSIGDDAVSCAGGTTMAVYTTSHATTSSAPSTTAQQDETTLAFQTIINTVMGSTTSYDDSLTTRQSDVSTQVKTEPLTSMDYITTTPVITVDISTVVPTDVSATTVQETTTGAPPFTEPSTEFHTTMSTDILSTMSTRFVSTDVYEPTTFQTLFSTNTPGRTISTDPVATVSTRGSTNEATLAITDETVTFSTSLLATDADEATTFQTLFSTNTPGRTISTDPGVTVSTRRSTDEATLAITDVSVTFSTPVLATDADSATTFQTAIKTDTPESTSGTESSVAVSTDVATASDATAINPATTMPTTEPITTGFTDLPRTDGNLVTTSATDVSATDDDVTTSLVEGTEVVTAIVTVTEGITEIDGFTTSPVEATEEVTAEVTVTEVITEIDGSTTPPVEATEEVTAVVTVTEGITEIDGFTTSPVEATEEVTAVVTVTEGITEIDGFTTSPVEATEEVTAVVTVTEGITEIDGFTTSPVEATEEVTAVVTGTEVITEIDGFTTSPVEATEIDGLTTSPVEATEVVTAVVTGTEVITDVDGVTTSPVEATEVVTAEVTVTEVITEIDGFTTPPVEATEVVTVEVTVTEVITVIDDLTTSPVEATEVVTAEVTVTEVVTEIDGFTTNTTTPGGSDMTTTMVPQTCEGFCDPDRERCVTGSEGPECECLPGFYRITEDKTKTDVQCTEAILFEVDARITEIDWQTVEFSEDLRNSSSARFIHLDDLICNAVASVQDSNSDFLVCQVTSFSDGSIIAAIELYFDALSNATEIEVYNETIAAFEENNITAEVTRVELVVPSIPTTVSAPTTTQAITAATTDQTSGRTTHTSGPITSSETAGSTSETESSTTQFATTAKPAKNTADTTLLVLYILIPVVALLLLIAIGFILYQNKKVSAQYGAYNPGGKKLKVSKTSKKANASNKDTNGHVNTAFYDGIVTSVDECTQTSGPQSSGHDRPDNGVVVTEDIDHMVYPYPWNEPGRLEGDDDVNAIYAKVDRKSAKEVTHKNPPVIVEIELKPVVVEEPQSPPVDWAAVDPELGAVEKETSVTEAVEIDSDRNSHDQDAVDEQVDDNENGEHEVNNTGLQTEVDEEPDYIVIEGFELNASSSNDGSTSKDDGSLNLDAISLELMSTMENEMDKRLNNRSTPC